MHVVLLGSLRRRRWQRACLPIGIGVPSEGAHREKDIKIPGSPCWANANPPASRAAGLQAMIYDIYKLRHLEGWINRLGDFGAAITRAQHFEQTTDLVRSGKRHEAGRDGANQMLGGLQDETLELNGKPAFLCLLPNNCTWTAFVCYTGLSLGNFC